MSGAAARPLEVILEERRRTAHAHRALEELLACAGGDEELKHMLHVLDSRLAHLWAEEQAAMAESRPDPVLEWSDRGCQVKIVPPDPAYGGWIVTIRTPAGFFAALSTELGKRLWRGLSSRHRPRGIAPAAIPAEEAVLDWTGPDGERVRVYRQGTIRVTDRDGDGAFRLDDALALLREDVLLDAFRFRLGRLGVTRSRTIELRGWRKLWGWLHWKAEPAR